MSASDAGVDLEKLVDLTRWIKTSDVPILSVTVSRKGKVFYELYTSGIDPNSAHYLMSVTKSFTSALMGVVIDRNLIPSLEAAVSNVLPRSVFPDDAAFERFQSVSVKDVLGMSALDAEVAPHQLDADAKKRLLDFMAAPNRTKFALTQKLLPKPGTDFQYTDVTPSLAAGMIEFVSGKSLLDLANESLFGPMHFENQEWMHEDRTGIDNGAFGIRLRPIDMQKFGMLYLNGGCWEDHRLLSKEWVDLSFSPWIKSLETHSTPNYGWYWWHYPWAGGWTAHIAAGWKGQRIAVFPEKDVVITMTALSEKPGEEDQLFGQVFSFVAKAIDGTPTDSARVSALTAELGAEIAAVRIAPTRIGPGTEKRMLPSIAPKERHSPFSASAFAR